MLRLEIIQKHSDNERSAKRWEVRSVYSSNSLLKMGLHAEQIGR
jgi:hypothetical protein